MRFFQFFFKKKKKIVVIEIGIIIVIDDDHFVGYAQCLVRQARAFVQGTFLIADSDDCQ